MGVICQMNQFSKAQMLPFCYHIRGRYTTLSKVNHFFWQVRSWCITVNSRIKSRGLDCDTLCPRCRLEKEIINHALFECSPVLHTWTFSFILLGSKRVSIIIISVDELTLSVFVIA